MQSSHNPAPDKAARANHKYLPAHPWTQQCRPQLSWPVPRKARIVERLLHLAALTIGFLQYGYYLDEMSDPSRAHKQIRAVYAIETALIFGARAAHLINR
ncbi:hypothetical protein [Sphingomonas sp. HMP6]|uniref:hypothetical protein n=1 Tax=Sphingomonas sp. HMP6 TaxID=1517551 RepID=UPI001596C67E|nr:hypothetical protein [Sphingomonas sp. HMP6]